jgi:hypothetical protein
MFTNTQLYEAQVRAGLFKVQVNHTIFIFHLTTIFNTLIAVVYSRFEKTAYVCLFWVQEGEFAHKVLTGEPCFLGET